MRSHFNMIAIASLASTVLLLAGATALADDKDKAAPPANSPECVKVRTDAPYRPYGYDHTVEVTNRCTYAVNCTVKTDVDPDASITLRVAAGKKESVVTRRGSPAAVFKADVRCKE